MAALLLGACGGGSSAKKSGTTSTTDPVAYATAYSVCLQFRNTDAARNAEPPTLTDDQADAVFAGLALQLKSASQTDPAWRKLQATADKLRRELNTTSASDDEIENTISKMGGDCASARKQPAELKVVPVPTTGAAATTTTA